MTKQRLDGEQIRSIFIKMCAKSMSECMAGNAVFPSQAFLMFREMCRNYLVVNRLALVPALSEKPVRRTLVRGQGIIVFENRVPCRIREEGISGRAVLGAADKDPIVGMLNVRTLQMPDFTGSQAGRVEDGDKCLNPDIGDCRDESPRFLL